MVNQITQMHMLAAQEQRARDIELRAYDMLETWLNEHPLTWRGRARLESLGPRQRF